MSETLDVVAVGIGPFNLALAALADDLPELRFAAYDAKPRFDWHPGVLFDWATVQVSFLADLVSLVRPTSRWSFLSYLADRDRMYQFYVAERFHLPRREYADYCGWAAERLPSTHFGVEVTALDWNPERRLWTVRLRDSARERTVEARHVVLGVGTRPVLPAPLRAIRGDRVIHSASYLSTVDGWGGDVRHVAVVGSGQSGAEVFLDLLRRQRERGWAVSWLTRTAGFAPLDYTKLVLEYTTPEYMHYFHRLEPAVRDRLIGTQWQLYKGIDSETIDAIHGELYHRLIDDTLPPVRLYPATTIADATRDGDGIELSCTHADTGSSGKLRADAVVAATGYAAEPPALLDPVRSLIDWDEQGRYRIDAQHRIRTAPLVSGGLYVQNAELHTHGAAAPDLGIGAYRSATILNAVTGREAFRLPKRTAFQTFGGVR
ncbi:SidA/IucD/PvdA family monooxygenase [Actinocatenispora sera]|uniref:lysine N(6)-hydroxylase/L-ornithine N(5)-oxygenase family protein n=1 Tax=Actinocatenispora sera TaxID=390989 RepID=UPI0033E2F1F2